MSFELAFYEVDHRLIACAMVLVMAIACEIGFRAGASKQDEPESFRSLKNGIGGAVFGLLALLLGFTLAISLGGWDNRRAVMIDESNAIGTLSLRAGLFEPSIRDPLRASLLEYTDARIELAVSGRDFDTYNAAKKKSEKLHSKIWSAVEQAGAMETSNAKLSSLITAANELIDLHELRISAVEVFLPASLFLILLSVATVAIYFIAWSFGAVGHGGRIAVLLLGLLIGTIIFLIMDVNRPQRGTFQVGIETLERARDSISVSALP